MQDNKNNIRLGIALVITAVSMVLLIAWTTGPFFYHFADTRLANTYSFIQLFATAYFSFLACKSLEKESSLKWQKNPSARPFFICAMGFLFLGLDDILSIHENLDRLIHLGLRMKETPWTDHIDDIILILYGVIAIFFIKDFIREFKRHPYMTGLIICGFFLFFVMGCLDFISNNDETFAYFYDAPGYGELRHTRDIFQMGDQSFQLLGEAAFLSAFVAAFVNIKTRKRDK